MLLEEQAQFCDSRELFECSTTDQNEYPTQTIFHSNSTSCFNKNCICTFQDNLSILECSGEQPIVFSGDNLFDFDFVSLIGNSVRELKEFKGLTLKIGDKILVEKIALDWGIEIESCLIKDIILTEDL